MNHARAVGNEPAFERGVQRRPFDADRGAGERVTLEGILDELGETTISGTPPDVRFHANLSLVTSNGVVHVLVWDDCIKAVRRVLPGATVRIASSP